MGIKPSFEMAKLWKEPISDSEASKAKRRSHYFTGTQEDWLHSKKKTYGYRERDEAKRQAFVTQLSTLLPSQIVYVDESGMDNRDEYGYGWNQQGERFHALKSGRRFWAGQHDCRIM